MKRYIPLVVIMSVLFIFFYSGYDHFFSFEILKQQREALLVWKAQHYLLSIVCFMLGYIITVAISFPGAIFLTLLAGFLYGIFQGTLYVLISATLGSCIIFLAIKLAFAPWGEKRVAKYFKKIGPQLQSDAFKYILILRLIPIFPFWMINIATALVGVRLGTFILATFIGIIPGTLIYTGLGNGMGYLLDQNKTPNLDIIFEPKILFPLIALALLAFIPSILKIKR